MTQRYLDATNDVAFKKVFSDKEILQDFLNSILRLPEGKKIIELTFVPQEELPPIAQGKRSIFDIKVRDQSDFWYIIEMQNKPNSLFLKRVQVYASATHSSQLKLGQPYSGIMPIVVISIVKGKNLFPKEVDCISCHTTRDEKTNTQHLFELTYVFVELDKFNKSEAELKTIEDYWLAYLSSSTNATHPPVGLQDDNILKAYEVLERFNWDEVAYDAYIRAKLLVESEEFSMEENYTKGKAEGLAEGKAEGLAEGLAEGEIKGEIKGKVEIAKNLIEKGFDEKTILELTGLTVQEVKKYFSK